MVGIIFSVIFAIYLSFNPLPAGSLPDPQIFGVILIAISTLFIIVQTLITGFAWTPLQKNEQNLVSRSIEMYASDKNLKLTNSLLLGFLLFSYLITIEIIFFDHVNKIYLLAIWTIALGFAVDLLHHFLNRIHQYLNPFKVTDLFVEKANESIQQDHERELCNWIDALSETGVKAILKNSPSLTNHAIDQLNHVMRNFLYSSKSFMHSEIDQESKEMGIQDRVSYTLFYFFEHLEQIHDIALEKNLETVSSRIIGVLGKTVVNAAKYDMTMATYPIHYLGKIAKKAQENGYEEIGNRAMLTLLEVSNRITTEVDIEYVNLQNPFLSIITYMDEIAKESFRQNKSINLQILIQPIRELKELFSTEELKSHQDTSVIVTSIDNVIDEFETLEKILNTMPPLSDIIEEKEEGEEKPKRDTEE